MMPCQSADPIPTRWLRDFRDGLAARDARDFVDWAARTAGPPILLDRQRFEPTDLKRWLGAISILQWDPDVADYRYRLFGTRCATVLGRDLTGRTLSAWPRKIAPVIRQRTVAVVTRRMPAGIRVATIERASGQVTRRLSVYEQVLWPLSYGPGTGAAVIAFAARVPDRDGLNPVRLRAATGRLGHWFTADNPAPSRPGVSAEGTPPA